MVVQIDIDLFEETLTDWFGRVTGRPVGLADLPSDVPNIPYAVLTPVLIGRGYGTEADPECMRDYVFQMNSVGKAPRQARWMAEQVRKAWTGRPGMAGQPAALTGVEGATVLAGSRMSDSLGAILKSPDGKLFQIIDTYRAKVE